MNTRQKFISYLFLFFSLGLFAADCNQYLQEEIARDLEKARRFWKINEPQIYYRRWIDDELAYKRFINPNTYNLLIETYHPLDMYKNSLKQYRAYKTGFETLMKIPQGQLELSTGMIQDLHRIIMKGVYRLDEKFLSHVPIINQFVVKAGKFKTFSNFGFHPLKSPISEADYKQIIENPFLKFIEIPFLSSEDKRRGLILFPSGKKVKEGMENLVKWFNENKDKVHPIYLAAKFQRDFVALHPFYNGNGRTSRLIMNRILYEFGYPPAIVDNHNVDLYVSEDEWVKMVADGVLKAFELGKETKRQMTTRKLYKTVPSVGLKDHGSYIKKFEDFKNVNVNIFPGRANSEVYIANERFILFKDGFFYNNKGIPHILHEKTFYPIADQTYLLYGMNGEFSPEVIKIAEKDKKTHYKRKNSVFQEEVFRDHLNFLDAYQRNAINKGEYKKIDYDVIAKANDRMELYIYPWQKNIILESIRIDEKNVMAILSPNNGQFTSFEQAFHRGGRVGLGTVIGQYQRVDLFYSDMERLIRAKFPEYISVIRESRNKIFKAAKKILEEFYSEFNKLPLEKKQILLKTPKIKLVNEYLKYTPLSEETFEQAMKMYNYDIYLLRSDLDLSKYIGFVSEADVKDLLARIPFKEKLFTYLKKRAEKNPNDAKLARFIERFSKSRYDFRGVDEEFQRTFIDLYLQALNDEGKEGVSFSTRPDQYINNYGNFPFQAISDSEYLLYVVKIPRHEALDNTASGWYKQYEIVVKDYQSPLKIFKKFKEEDFSFDESALSAEDLKLIKDFYDDVYVKDYSDLSID
ncbi:MAG: Fic family protein [Halobacteriovoraceae bacterium]|nr:Fic family protein [Halobacteriovoraceae bacterium]MCB9093622.1 Fic family protein [Halobacteriovoraceae bacterium]